MIELFRFRIDDNDAFVEALESGDRNCAHKLWFTCRGLPVDIDRRDATASDYVLINRRSDATYPTAMNRLLETVPSIVEGEDTYAQPMRTYVAFDAAAEADDVHVAYCYKEQQAANPESRHPEHERTLKLRKQTVVHGILESAELVYSIADTLFAEDDPYTEERLYDIGFWKEYRDTLDELQT